MRKIITALFIIICVAGIVWIYDAGRSRAAIPSEVRRIKAEWEKEMALLRSDGKIFVTLRVTRLKQILDRASRGALDREFNRICATNVPVFEKDYDKLEDCYDTVLLEALVARAIDRKDASGLGALLKNNFPGTLEHLMPLEFYCADLWPPSILILFDVREQTQSKIVKDELLKHLGHAFDSLRTKYPDDATFLVEARKWFSENQGKLEVNYDYPYLAARPAPPTEKNLFLLKK